MYNLKHTFSYVYFTLPSVEYKVQSVSEECSLISQPGARGRRGRAELNTQKAVIQPTSEAILEEKSN